MDYWIGMFFAGITQVAVGIATDSVLYGIATFAALVSIHFMVQND